jgi:SAM-dependent methyltransferase
MNPLEKKDVVKRYAERITRLGPVVQALGWRNEAQQNLRFEVFADLIDFSSPLSVLDIGCGFGDFYKFLLNKKQDIKYIGCDISPHVVEIAGSQNKGGSFEVRDISIEPYSEGEFDYVCMSGIFNFRINDNIKYLNETIISAFKFSRQGIIFNLTTDLVDYQSPELFYYNPEEVFGLCRKLSRSIIMRHDYPLYEFTVLVKKC